jgi:hypothetical protein
VSGVHAVKKPLNNDRAKSRKPEQPSGGVTKRFSASRVLLCLALAGFLGITIWLNATVNGEQQFVFLAQSFLHGNLAFMEQPGASWADTTPHNGSYYWPLGPLPAVALMPFELLASSSSVIFYQGYLQPLLVLVLLWLVFRIARLTGYDAEDGAYLAFGFAFATAFLGVAMWPWSWQFSQVLTCVLVFGAIAETVGRRRPLVIGTLFALVLATRVTAALGMIWSLGEVLRTTAARREKLRSIVVMGIPCLVALMLLLLYNHARFGDAFDQGYAKQIVPPHYEAARAQGMFSLRHLPCNLYYLLLASPVAVRHDNISMMLTAPFVVANPWGMSIFLTSTCFLYLFGLRYPDATSRLLWLAVFVIALPILLYFGVGFRQFGYRYALDFAPFLYYLLLRNHRLQRGKLTPGFKAVLVISAIWNLYLFGAYFIWRT